jgi:PIN domain nuclease of toxin-antitoxin system
MATEPQRLSPKVQGLVDAPDNRLYISAISAFEIAVKSRKGKLVLPLPAREWVHEALAAYRIEDLPITSEIAALSQEVDVPHSDPCDRLIAATALTHGIAVATPDPMIRACKDIEVIW